MTHEQRLESLSDDDLLRRLSDLVQKSRRVESELVAHIGEVDRRGLYASEAAAPSMFVYCLQALHLSEHEAYLRITAARASRKYPLLLDMLADGRLHLSGIAKLAPHLTEENCDALLTRAAHKSKRQIEELSLRCRAHNAYQAELDYGKEVMERYRRSGSRVREPAPVYGAPDEFPWYSPLGNAETYAPLVAYLDAGRR